MRFFELSVALKYLVPRKKQLSVSLIALMSVAVISLVVWLLLVFLSITDGMEKNWLHKLTSLNAPLKITPKESYFSSFYYQVDSISAASEYTHKSLAEKASSPSSDPYDPASDMEIPAHWPVSERNPDGSLKDPVKALFHILKNTPGITFQDYEVSGALMRLQMRRPESSVITAKGNENQQVMTQASYLATFAEKNPHLSTLLSAPSARDLNTLFYLANNKGSEGPFATDHFQSRLHSLLDHAEIEQLKTQKNHWKLPASLLPEGSSFHVQDQKTHLILSSKTHNAILKKEGGRLTLNGKAIDLPLFVDEELSFKTQIVPASLEKAHQLKEIRFNVQGTVQGKPLRGELFWDGLEIASAKIKTDFDHAPKLSPPWIYRVKDKIMLPKTGVILAKNFQDSGVRIGDRGYLSYAAVGSSSVQEQRSPVYVAGFYDPGVLSIGSKCILAHAPIVHSISHGPHASTIDKTQSSGIQVWFDDLSRAQEIKHQLVQALAAAGVDSYWEITTFHEYDFAKDLLQQFSSDKTLFTLLGVMILIIASCNIISLLVLLVNDKKKEIGILQAMGASPFSIAAIFGLCGVLLGVLSSALGILAALFTLHHIDSIVHVLNVVQGHEMFNAAFYGTSLPNLLSHDALVFVLIATPIVSLLAGLIPALKACRLQPSAILRSE